MFKVAYISTVDGLKEARGLLKQIYDENPKHWPNGLTPEHFDGGLYLVREASTGTPVGFCGWQERDEVQQLLDRPIDVRKKEAGDRHVPGWDAFFKSMGCRHVKTGYYSIGILREYRRNGFAKEALQKLISIKSAGVDRVRALIMASNNPSLALADSLGVEKVVKRAASQTEKAVDYTGAGAAGLGAGGIMATGLGKSTPSFLDLAHRMFTGPNGAQLFEELASRDPAGAAALQRIATKYPSMFKLALLGVRMPGVNVETQMRLKEFAFNIRPSSSQLGDVMVSGPKDELLSGMGRLRHAVSGSGLQHTAVGLPEHMNSWAFLAGRGQGVERWAGNWSDLPHAAVNLRPMRAMDASKLTENINEAFSQPYSYGRLRRLGVQEALATPWTDKAGPTLMERGLNLLGTSPTVRTYANMIPGMKEQLVKNRAACRMMGGHVCSTAIADAFQKSDPKLFGGKNPLGVSPGDFLRRVGKDFDVTALNLPSALQARPQLILNHMLKAGPIASRALLAAPLLGAGAYLYNRATRPEESLWSRMRNAVSR